MKVMDDSFLDQELAELEAAASTFAKHFITDAKVRWDYLAQVKRASQELQEYARNGRISWRRAAEQAHSIRNLIMEAQRGRSSAFGLSLARMIKAEGQTLRELEDKYADRLFGKKISALSVDEKNKILQTIVKKAGEPQMRANNVAVWMGRAGRGLAAVTIIIAIYHVLQAEEKVRAMANEGVVVAGGMAGGAALGAVGLACGPAAIVCVPVSIFVGGIVGAMGGDWVFDRIWR